MIGLSKAQSHALSILDGNLFQYFPLMVKQTIAVIKG